MRKRADAGDGVQVREHQLRDGVSGASHSYAEGGTCRPSQRTPERSAPRCADLERHAEEAQAMAAMTGTPTPASGMSSARAPTVPRPVAAKPMISHHGARRGDRRGSADCDGHRW